MEDPICTLLREAVMENALWSIDYGWLPAAHPAARSFCSSTGQEGAEKKMKFVGQDRELTRQLLQGAKQP